jgi:predicted metalloprotease with PDZ domain
VQPGSGAENAGLKPGDRLLVLGGVSTGKKTTSVYLSAMPADGTRAAR